MEVWVSNKRVDASPFDEFACNEERYNAFNVNSCMNSVNSICTNWKKKWFFCSFENHKSEISNACMHKLWICTREMWPRMREDEMMKWGFFALNCMNRYNPRVNRTGKHKNLCFVSLIPLRVVLIVSAKQPLLIHQSKWKWI